MSQFGADEWVEIIDPSTKSVFYANPMTGDCSWDRPKTGRVRPKDPNGEWWELFDDKHQLNYYYNTITGVTDWKKPAAANATVIPLHVIQNALKKAQDNQKNSASTAAASSSKTKPADADSNIRPSSVAESFRSSRSSSKSNVDPPNAGDRPSSIASTRSPLTGSASPAAASPIGPSAYMPKRNSIAMSNSPSPEARKSPLAKAATMTKSSGDLNNIKPIENNLGNHQAVSSRSIVMLGVDESSSHNVKAYGGTFAYGQKSGSGPTLEKWNSSASIKSLPEDLKAEIGQFMMDGFAKKFFTTHKRGILRRKVPVEKMLIHTKDLLNQPLLSLNKNLHKEALKCFKTIQRIMGDRSPPSSNWKAMEGILYLLELGVTKGEMRDEIYVQICKQLTDNPNGESIVKGWELMCILSTAFPPSKNFEDYLKNFLLNHWETSSNNECVFAQHCMSRFLRICRTGPRGKVPTIAEIERAREAPFNPSVFGETLEDIMRMQENSHPNLKVPRILPFLCDAVLAMNGQQCEGIFRVPADSEKTTELRLKLEKGIYDLGDLNDPNVPASLLKFWLRDLADPLIPADKYQTCIDCGEEITKARTILQSLPIVNREVVIYVIKFLQIMARPENQKSTKMTVNNLAMVFAPNFLRCPSDNPQVILQQTKFEQLFLVCLIKGLQ